MDAALRRLQRDGDLAREAIMETRVGGGVAGWLDSQPGERPVHYSERAGLLTVFNILDPGIELDAEERTNWIRLLGSARGVYAVRFETLIVVSLTVLGFPVMLDWMEMRTRILRPDDESYGAFDVRAGRPRCAIKDARARGAFDMMLWHVRRWGANLQKLQGVPAMAFTLEQTRIYRGLDPYGR